MKTQQPAQTKEIQPSNDKEVRLATAVKALPNREADAYKYFVNKGQVEVSPDKAEELFRLYQLGNTCEDIRRLFPAFSLGQVVACRVMRGWDERRANELKSLQKEVPAQIETAQLETQVFLASLLHASHKRWSDALRLYIATGDQKHLEDAKVPVPKTMKELRDLTELYMKVSGTDTKMVEVSVSGGVQHTVAKVTPEEAASIMDDLLGDNVQDAEFTEEKPKQIEAPRTAEETVEFLVKSGMSREKAEQVARAPE